MTEKLEERFAQWVSTAILRLPQDLKAALRIVEDADVADEARVVLAGALLSVLGGANHIPGLRGLLGLVDDVLVLRLALERVQKASPEAFAEHLDPAGGVVGGLADELGLIRKYLGPCTQPLEKAVDGFVRVTHQGHSAPECVHDVDANTWLYDAVQEAIVERFEFDEEAVVRDTRAVDTIRSALQSRMPRA